MRPLRSISRLAVAACFAAGAAGAAEYTVQPGAEGEDNAPYSFLPSLSRGQHTTLYAFHALDEGVAHDFETYLKFPLPPIPAGESVVQATLWVDYAFEFGGFGNPSPEPGQLRCHEVLEAWSEDSLTWTNKPDVGSALDTVTNITALGPLSCDVTALVAAWLSGAKTNHGIALTNPTARVLGFYSFEDTTEDSIGKKARLVIETSAEEIEDLDGDGVGDTVDNCPDVPNTAQADGESDGVGDACDVCPAIGDPEQVDTDGDGRGDRCGPEALDFDEDGLVTKADKKLYKKTCKKKAAYSLACDLDGDGVMAKADKKLFNVLFKQFRVKRAKS